MPKHLAIALCRVSSTEQLENNSLNRQREVVLKAANELGVMIPDDCWWSGSVSSKRGTNVDRKDLNQMIVRCKKDKRIKYIIVDEPDRFMRSIDEAAFFEVTFRQLGVTVWYASDAELNKGDLAAKLLKFTKYLSAEGSNEERQRKSINGQTKALQEGRYTFCPKPGYMRGDERGIHKPHPVRGQALRKVLLDIVTKRVTPTQGLINLNSSEFMRGHSLYKMDKFRKIATDIYYAGGVAIDKQVKVHNLNGLHEPLITLEQHHELLRIFGGKQKNQTGPRKNGNPKYPLNNIIHCDVCEGKQYNRIVGVDITNGKSPKIYEKYRCRACKRALARGEMHDKITKQLRNNPITDAGVSDLTKALDIVWKRRESENQQEAVRLRHKLASLQESISQQVEAATDPENAAIKSDILTNIAKRKQEAEDIEDQLHRLTRKAEDDYERFLKFAFGFVGDTSQKFLDPLTPHENRLRFKQIVFPAGFRLDANKNVYTPEISELIRLAGNKKDLSITDKSHLVRVKRL
ncbi:recombinase family protein [Candidatus Saccharibacteria bacterium]|nr:recombinase family protein [Candidatus Saccharibacteria bacterium]